MLSSKDGGCMDSQLNFKSPDNLSFFTNATFVSVWSVISGIGLRSIHHHLQISFNFQGIIKSIHHSIRLKIHRGYFCLSNA